MENFTANVTQPSGDEPTIQSVIAGKLDSHTWQVTEWRGDTSEFPGSTTFRPDGESGLLSEGNYLTVGITPSTMTANVEGRYRAGESGTWIDLHKDTQNNSFNFTFVYPQGLYPPALEFQLYDPTTETVYDTATYRFINEVNE